MEKINNQYLEVLKQVPVMSIPNIIRQVPYEHVGGIYYYHLFANGKPLSLVVNTSRNQWYADKDNHGDDAVSLAIFVGKSYSPKSTEQDLIDDYGKRIYDDLVRESEAGQRIPFKDLPIRSRKWVAKRYDLSFLNPFIKGLSIPVLKKHCYVVYRTRKEIDDDDARAEHYREILRTTKDLNQLPDEDKKAIGELFTTAIALRNVNGGLQVFDGETSFPLQQDGYCLFGGEEVEKGEKLFVYENIMDYLALMEMRHKNGTDAIMPPTHHIILNGDKNLAEALSYIHARCDFLDVVCMFPNDDVGHQLFKKVRHATRDTADDASQRLYVKDYFFSLSSKTAMRYDMPAYHADKKEIQKEIEKQLARTQTQGETQGKENAPDLSGKRKDRTILIPSPPKVRANDKTQESRSGFKL